MIIEATRTYKLVIRLDPYSRLALARELSIALNERTTGDGEKMARYPHLFQLFQTLETIFATPTESMLVPPLENPDKKP